MSAVELLQYAFVQRALLAGLLVALVASVLGVYIVLRGLSLLGDGLAHLSFAGVAIGLVTGIYPLGIALVFAIIGALVIHGLQARGVVKSDTAIGILFTAGLALGILVISRSGGFGTGVESYLFGSLLAVAPRDLVLVALVGGTLLVLLAALHKEFFYLTFSEEAARISGLPVGALNVVFTILTAATIVVTTRVVGVLLVSALIIVPTAASLQWSRSFRGALVGSVLAALTSVVAGVLASAQWSLATGASIAMASAILFGLSVATRAVVRRAA